VNSSKALYTKYDKLRQEIHAIENDEGAFGDELSVQTTSTDREVAADYAVRVKGSDPRYGHLPRVHDPYKYDGESGTAYRVQTMNRPREAAWLQKKLAEAPTKSDMDIFTPEDPLVALELSLKDTYVSGEAGSSHTCTASKKSTDKISFPLKSHLNGDTLQTEYTLDVGFENVFGNVFSDSQKMWKEFEKERDRDRLTALL
jgi:hypothetical protein